MFPLISWLRQGGSESFLAGVRLQCEWLVPVGAYKYWCRGQAFLESVEYCLMFLGPFPLNSFLQESVQWSCDMGDVLDEPSVP